MQVASQRHNCPDWCGGVNGAVFPEGGSATGIKGIRMDVPSFDPAIPTLGMYLKDNGWRNK